MDDAASRRDGPGPAPEPVGALPHAVDLPVLGVPTRFEASHAVLLDHVLEAFGAWRVVAARTDLLQQRRVRVRLVLHDDDPADADRAALRYHTGDPMRILVETPGSRGVADLARDEAVAHVTPTLVADGAHFRYAVLSALTLAVVTARDRRPLHAAAVAGRGAVLLLHGPSGVGKSTLALAAARRGLAVLSDDAVYAQLDPRFRVWGLPGPLHVPPEALALFPDVRAGDAVVRAAGRVKVAVDARAAGPRRGAGAGVPVRERAGLCLLARSAGAPDVRPASAQEVAAAVGDPTEPGFDRFRGQMHEVVGHIVAGGAWHLAVGSDPPAAAAAVAELLERVEDGGPGAGEEP